MSCVDMIDIELGLKYPDYNNILDENYDADNEIQIDTKETQDIFNYSASIFSISTMREENTPLFKKMVETAYILISDPNITEYFVYQETKHSFCNHYLIKYYLRHENNIFYKVVKKYYSNNYTKRDKDVITEYYTLNEFIFDYESV